MPDPILRLDFYPNLQQEGYNQESSATPAYNCIAWAVGDDTSWWWPKLSNRSVSYWPAGCPNEETINSFQLMFRSLGYTECLTDDVEHGYEKIVLYALNGIPTHAARQDVDGKWLSKIGQYIDIRHTLRGLEGPRYGQVVKYFKKQISNLV